MGKNFSSFVASRRRELVPRQHGFKPQTTMFGLAFDERQPKRMYCATSGGEVFASEDGGESWTECPLPEGATQVYAMGCA